MPMVKANAYGHGALPVAKALSDLAPAFGVACIEEAIDLRKAGIKQPILLLEGTYSADEVPVAEQENFWLVDFDCVERNTTPLTSSMRTSYPYNISS